MFTRAQNELQTAAVNEAKTQASDTLMTEVQDALQSGDYKLALACAAVGGVVAGVCYVDLKWHQRAEAEHLRQVNLVEANHAKYLTGIHVNQADEIDLPTIFTRNEQTGKLDAVKDYKTIDELRKMVNERPSIGFPTKASVAVTRAMQKILEFYEERLERAWLWTGTEGDVTSAFLRYHLCRLFEYGKNFRGTDYTGRIISHLHDSLNHFSVEHGENSERRIYLDLACRAMKRAVAELEQQKRDRTLADLVAESTPKCDEYAIRLLHNLTKYITPTKYRKYIDRSLDTQLLAEGFIRKAVPHTKLGSHTKAIMLHNSPVGRNIQIVAKNYNEAKGLRQVQQFGSVPTPILLLNTKNFTREEQKQNLTIFTESSVNLKLFQYGQRIQNAITTLSRIRDSKTESGETVPLTQEDHKIILDRLTVLHALANLVNDDVLIIKLFLKLEHYAKEKGNEFISNPKNAHFMFDVLLALGSQVRKDAIVCEMGLNKIEEDHQLKTLPPEEAFLLYGTKQLVVAIRDEIDESVKAIKNYRTETHYETLENEIRVSEHETLKLFAGVAQLKGIRVPQIVAAATGPLTSLSARPVDATGRLIVPPLTRPPSTYFAIASALNQAQSNKSSSSSASASLLTVRAPRETTVPAALRRRVVAPARPKPKVSFEAVQHLLTDIQAQILQVGKEEWKRPYERIYDVLIRLYAHCCTMHQDPDSDHRLKAERTKALLYEVCEFMYAFLQCPLALRHAQFQAFANEIDAKIQQPGNNFLDEHFGVVDQFISENRTGILSIFYRPPTSRQIIGELQEACHRLGRR